MHRTQTDPAKASKPASSRAPSRAPSTLGPDADRRPGAALQRRLLGTIDASPRVVQRVLPQRRQVTEEVGEPKANTRPVKFGLRTGFRREEKEQATNYRPVLDALDAVDTYLRGNEVGDDAGTIMGQLSQILGLYDTVWETARAYIEAKADKTRQSTVLKKAYMGGLMRQVSRERVVLESVAREAVRTPVRTFLGAPTWYGLLSSPANRDRAEPATPLAAPTPVDLGAAQAGPVHGGGINQVTEFDAGGVDSFFKPEKDRIDDPEELGRRQPAPSEAELEAAGKEFGIAEDFGIDAADPQLAKRDVAMSRLDALLGAGVIARAELAVRNGVTGSLMDSSVGQGRLRAGDAQLSEGPADGRIDLRGAGIQRALSRLQLIDILAMQADRHMGNYFFHVAGNQVVGVTGIDNDLSFGTRTGETPRQEFPGISRFVDKQLAQRILALHPDDLRWALAGLLAPAEVNAAVARLQSLQDHLRDDQTRLLEPNQWDAATAADLWDEGRSYHQSATREYRKTQQTAAARQGGDGVAPE